jgi:radical SAM protein with 4Fe4S-binding SPASM domain
MTANEETPSKTFCVLPWTHLNFEPNGKVLPCCLMSNFLHVSGWSAGDLNNQTIEEIWNGDALKTLRKQMLSGEKPKLCHKCFDREKAVPGDSSRIAHNNEFKEKIKEIREITSEDGSVSKIDLKYWDFRFSNKCNFKCRSCGPDYSSNWVEDTKKMIYFGREMPEYLPPDQDPRNLWNHKLRKIDNVDTSSRFEFLKKHVKEVEKIYFAGGEPLIMDEHYFILDMLLEQGRTDVKLTYNTNTSTLLYKGKSVLDYWSKWDKNKVHVWSSIDEVGPRAELVRKGTEWAVVESNLKQISALGVNLVPGVTVSAFNVFRLPEIIEKFIEIGIVSKKQNYNNWSLNPLYTPDYYHVSILSDSFRREIGKKINDYIDYAKKTYNVDFTDKFGYLKSVLAIPHNPDFKNQFIETTRKLDIIRGENTFEIIPELKDVFNHD